MSKDERELDDAAAEGSDLLDHEFDRRQFLKLAGGSMAAVTVVAMTVSCDLLPFDDDNDDAGGDDPGGDDPGGDDPGGDDPTAGPGPAESGFTFGDTTPWPATPCSCAGCLRRRMMGHWHIPAEGTPLWGHLRLEYACSRHG